MPKRIYRAVDVQQIEAEAMIARLENDKKLVFGCDAAKDSWRGAFMTPSSEVIQILRWDLQQTPVVVELLQMLSHRGIEVHVVAEPTGTYADAFAAQVLEAGLAMYAVSPKHTHDYAEIYDGVASQHDSKDATIVAKLHLERRQPTRWPTPTLEQRELLLKHLGLNLRERSSGKFKGRLKISKRGNPIVRRWLYLAALRLIKDDPVVRAWVEHKAVQSGGKPMKMKAIIALMRKIVTALRHVADGNPFDSTKLFDVQRLKRLHALPQNFHQPCAA